MEPNGRRLDSTVNQSDLAPWRANVAENQSFCYDGTRRSVTLENDTGIELNASISMLSARRVGDGVIRQSHFDEDSSEDCGTLWEHDSNDVDQSELISGDSDPSNEQAIDPLFCRQSYK
jgi:hypothetical protein